MENKYAPLTEEQFLELDSVLTKEIGAYIPENRMNYVWSTRNLILNLHEPQPCGCASAGALWKNAVDFLNQWVKDRK